MKRNQPFAQAKQMMAAIASIMANNPSHLHPGLIGALGPYKSRGKGRGTPSKVFYRNRSKYTPHIEAKESAKFVARQEVEQVPCEGCGQYGEPNYAGGKRYCGGQFCCP